MSVICPGYIKTPMTQANAFPMPLLMEAEEAARLIRRGLARHEIGLGGHGKFREGGAAGHRLGVDAFENFGEGRRLGLGMGDLSGQRGHQRGLARRRIPGLECVEVVLAAGHFSLVRRPPRQCRWFQASQRLRRL
ncbi:MAG: hypothetical protein IIB62_00790 [Proteobacteria bacterium]|nr:hypothetical protein [Pseudomonadota bacterium]